MPLTQQHQIAVLRDILNNHQSDACGSVSECEQVERLVEALLAKGELNEQLIPILNEIQQYSHTGASTEDLNTHITAHQEQLSQWIDGVDQYYS
ncbi:YtzH-like family protein [Bacillus testis]|uniref:YtzH-like family protein n=1 Tax=Bacillus testis TaxID=1622072 RepID=UPI00067E8EF0|nr:YtzH-like family protein [Bacillus testis]